MNKMLCIDPGLSKRPGGTGWALFGDELFPERTGIVEIAREIELMNWEIRADYILEKLRSKFVTNIFDEEELYPDYFLATCCEVYIELPTFFQSTTGIACATGKDGGESDLMKLIILAGRILQLFKEQDFQKVEFVRVNEWKGTMSKPAVASRIERRIGKHSISSHALDATGIGLYKKGVFSPNTASKLFRK